MEDLRVVVSMIVMCNAKVVTEYDRRRPGLPSVPLNMEYGNNITDESTAIALNPKKDTCIIHILSVNIIIFFTFTLT